MTGRTRDRVLSVVRHPGFAPEIAARVVSGLSRHDLQELWGASQDAVHSPQQPGELLSFVVLRDALLQEMERTNPVSFGDWYAAQLRSPQRRSGLAGRLRAFIRR